jgi:hypothetical protein
LLPASELQNAYPQWQYENPPIGDPSRSIERHYPTMAIEEISALPINDIAYEHCVFVLVGNQSNWRIFKVILLHACRILRLAPRAGGHCSISVI